LLQEQRLIEAELQKIKMTQNGEKVKKQKEEAKLRKLLTAERKTELIVRELAKLQREATKVAVE
jgi:vancomycin resistance protein YoaR